MKSEYALFKVSERLLNTLTQIEEAEGELTPELESALEINQEELETSIIDYVKAVDTWEKAHIPFLEEKIQELATIKERLKKRCERVDDALLAALLTHGAEDKPTKAQREKGWEGTRRLKIHSNEHYIELSNTRRELVFLNDFDPDKEPDYCEIAVRVPYKHKDDVVEALKAKGITASLSGGPIISKTAIKEAIEEGKDVIGAKKDVKYYLKKKGM